MHFYYLDEAGCNGADLTNTEQPIFVLGGISVRDDGWGKTQEEFARIIGKYFSGSVPANFELHAEQLLSPKGDGAFSNHDRNARNQLAKELLGILTFRKHHVHLLALHKQKMNNNNCNSIINFNYKIPYLLAYDYLLTHVNESVKQASQSARAMFIIDEKAQFAQKVEEITHFRRFEDTKAHRIKQIVEFTYPVDSRKNPMVQLSDLVVFCTKKFYEVEAGYRNSWPQDAKKFFAECYMIIDSRHSKKTFVSRLGRGMDSLNTFIKIVSMSPRRAWKNYYDIG